MTLTILDIIRKQSLKGTDVADKLRNVTALLDKIDVLANSRLDSRGVDARQDNSAVAEHIYASIVEQYGGEGKGKLDLPKIFDELMAFWYEMDLQGTA